MPKVDAWVDECDSHLKIEFDDDGTVIINLDGFEFACGSTDAREIGQRLIEIADQFNE